MALKSYFYGLLSTYIGGLRIATGRGLWRRAVSCAEVFSAAMCVKISRGSFEAQALKVMDAKRPGRGLEQ